MNLQIKYSLRSDDLRFYFPGHHRFHSGADSITRIQALQGVEGIQWIYVVSHFDFAFFRDATN